MLVREVMNTDIKTITPDANIVDVASQMRDGDFGVMPVYENDRLVGMITDRDIAVRAVAEGKDVRQCLVRDVMTPDVLTCFEDDEIQDVVQLMSDRQVRRVPVVDQSKKLVGIVSLGDLTEFDETCDDAGLALQKVSEPRHDEPTQSHH